MNMSDEVDGDNFHGTRESYSHLSDVEWGAIERMSSTVGEEAIWAMLSLRDRDQQHAVISQFLQRELDESQAKVTLLQQQDHQRTEALRQQQSQSIEPTRERRRESLKLEVTKYRGVEEDSLLRWFVELDDAIDSRRIDDERMQVSFAQSNLAGEARAWALNLKLHDPNVFGSFRIFKTLLSETFEPPRAEFRTLSELLQLKQGKRKVHAYAQHVRYLASCMVVNPVNEFVLITIFIQGLSDGPVRDHLFRGELKTLSEAIHAAEQEDYSVRQSHATSAPYRPLRRPAVGGPEPMDLCLVEGEKPRPMNDKRMVRCHRCHKLGHYAYECSIPRSEPRGAERNVHPPARRTGGRGSVVVAKSQHRSGPSKNGRDQ